MAVDLSDIHFRSFEEGDIESDQSKSNIAESSTTPIDLSAIKFRAKEFGDAEEEQE